MDFSKITFRCSSLGHIMVDAKGKSNRQKYDEAMAKLSDTETAISETKNKDTKTFAKLIDTQVKLNELLDKLEDVKDFPHLSESCKTFLCDLYVVLKYGRTEDIKSKYLEKGLRLEEDAITLYSLVEKTFYKKNKVRERNEWIEGEVDIFAKDFVGDTKANWGLFQFTRTAAKPTKLLYVWQIKGYCWLFKKKLGKLIYCLLNTPEHLIVAEERRLLYDFLGSQDEYKEACIELRKNHIFDDIPEREKVREYPVEFNLIEDTKKIKQRVEDCRWYLANVIDKLKTDSDESEEE